MEKCAIFIDGGYLDKLLENWGNFPLDYLKFSEKLCKIIGAKLLRVYYYNCLPKIRKMYEVSCSKCGSQFEAWFKQNGERRIYCEKCFEIKKKQKPSFIKITPEQTKKDEKFFDERERFYSKLKRLPHFEVKYGDLQIIQDKPKQKGIDVRMSLDIVDKCFEGQIQHVILIAGDSDFIPAIRKAKDYGAIVHLFCNKNKVNRKILFEVDKVHHLKLSFIKDIKMTSSKP